MSESARPGDAPDPEYPRIVTELLAVPHIQGRRISVLDIHDRVEGRGLAPRDVADRFDLDIADVYRALTYYHDHPAEMTEIRRHRGESLAELREEVVYPDDVNPPSDE